MIHPALVSVNEVFKVCISLAHQLHSEECRLADIHRPVIRLSWDSLAASVGPFFPDKVILQLFLKEVSVDLVEGLRESSLADKPLRKVRGLEEEDIWIPLLREESLAGFHILLYRVIVTWRGPLTDAVLFRVVIAHSNELCRDVESRAS